MTLQEFTSLRPGHSKVKVISNISNHDYIIGQIYKVTRVSGDNFLYLGSSGYYVGKNEVELVLSYNEETLFLKTAISQAEKTIKDAKERIEWLSKYKNNLDEAVQMVAEAIGIVEGETIKKMYGILKGAGIDPDFIKPTSEATVLIDECDQSAFSGLSLTNTGQLSISPYTTTSACG